MRFFVVAILWPLCLYIMMKRQNNFVAQQGISLIYVVIIAIDILIDIKSSH